MWGRLDAAQPSSCSHYAILIAIRDACHAERSEASLGISYAFLRSFAPAAACAQDDMTLLDLELA
jgi:hypothetical protein